MTLSGPEPVSAPASTTSPKEAGLGKGSWVITESVPREQASATRSTTSERGSNKRISFIFKPTGRNNRNVEITQTYDVDYGWNLLGRYAGMYVSRHVGDDIKLTLSRVVDMLAAVPNYDYAVSGSKMTGARRSPIVRSRTCCS